MAEAYPQQQPQNLDATTLASVGDPIAAQLVPGWRVTWCPCSQEQIDRMIPGALAVCRPIEDTTPTRSMATVYVVTPWPAGESLAETLWHELTHAALAPLVALIPDADTSAGVMVEEQIVERLGCLLAKVPTAARRAISRALGEPRVPAPLRARISASAARARVGGAMDPKLLQEALEALMAGDQEKVAEILKSLIVSAASGGAPPPAERAPSSEAGEAAKAGAPPKPDEMQQPPGGDATAGGYGARQLARKGATEVNDEETQRARKAAKDAAAEIQAMATAQRPAALETLVVGLRARLGARLTPAAEKQIMAAPSFQEAQMLAAFAETMGGEGTERARSGVEHGANPGPGDKGEANEKLLGEGFGPSWITMYRATVAKDPVAGAQMLAAGRASRARLATNGATAPGKAG